MVDAPHIWFHCVKVISCANIAAGRALPRFQSAKKRLNSPRYFAEPERKFQKVGLWCPRQWFEVKFCEIPNLVLHFGGRENIRKSGGENRKTPLWPIIRPWITK